MNVSCSENFKRLFVNNYQGKLATRSVKWRLTDTASLIELQKKGLISGELWKVYYSKVAKAHGTARDLKKKQVLQIFAGISHWETI